MKNYEIKNATADLSLNQKIVVSGKRLAYLVPNMFNKVLNGFKKMSKIPGKVLDGVSNIATNIGNSIAESSSIQTALQDAQIVREDIAAKQIAGYEEKRAQKEEAIAAIKVNENLTNEQKSYIIKAYETDIQRLQSKSARVSSAPRRLLISTVFIGKLISNSRNKRINNKVAQKLESIPNVETNAPVAQDSQEAVQTQEQAKERYRQLDDQRLSYLEKVRIIQEEMTNLVKEYKLTREMFEETQKTR